MSYRYPMCRLCFVFILIALITLLLAACGGEEVAPPASASEAETTATAEPQAIIDAPPISSEAPTSPSDSTLQPTLTASTPSNNPAPTATNPVPTSTAVSFIQKCPTGVTNHADLMNFNWQSRPMQSREVADIVFSTADPDILYLAVEVNQHSLYRSSDGGRSWSLLHMYGHSKDLTVHLVNPEIAFYTDSQGIWKTISGRSDGNIHSSFERVLMHSYPAGPSQTSFSSVVLALQRRLG